LTLFSSFYCRPFLEVPLKLLFALSSGRRFPPAQVGFRSEAGAKLNFGLKSGHQLHRAQRSLVVTFFVGDGSNQ